MFWLPYVVLIKMLELFIPWLLVWLLDLLFPYMSENVIRFFL